MARLRDAERLALLRPVLLRPELLRPADLRPVDFRLLDRVDFRALLRAELRLPRLDDLLDFLADRRALLRPPLRADFPVLLRFADRLADFLRDPPLRDRLVPPVLLGEGSSKSNDDEDDPGEEGEGVLSEGSGSIQPEPDQPISI